MDNTWAKTSLEQAMAFAEHLRQIIQQNLIREETTINNSDIEAKEQISTIRKTTKSEIKKN